jgi:multisubunit Na+/H+ antiporter MnhB subunit
VLRPGVAGGLVGVVNVAVLSAIGYLSYKHWNLPRWDRQTVSSVVVGLVALSAAEGYLGKQYKDKELPRQKRKGNVGGDNH